MTKITFRGTVASGIGRYATLSIPGRSRLDGAPPDWPEALYPGSLNIRVSAYPSDSEGHALINRVEELDQGRFAPTFEIPRQSISNNQLGPRPGLPRGGDAQVWRAELLIESDGRVICCWVLRRFGSTVGEQLELVADRRLRDEGLPDGCRVGVVLEGTWLNGGETGLRREWSRSAAEQ